MCKKWYTIRIKPQSEQVAATVLESNDYEVFLPLVQMRFKGSKRVEAPLFPGYMFLRHDADENGWPSLHQLTGVLGWVRVGDEIPSLSDELIGSLEARLLAMNSEGGLWKRFHSGETVRVVSGGIESLAEIIEEPNSSDTRVKVLLEFLGRQIQAQVPLQSLQPVAQNEETERYKRPRRTRGRGRWIQQFRPLSQGALRS